ncbi:hypothetical protein F7R20_29235 [Pseudomonas brassicacearum subsp. brassicacearum]|nr:hypothetical protein F7R20_29235 [Pseudomonas brassicacearum subsp. brassicacearum]QEO80988.1 hypothetical protein ELZ14_26890 [Pseudomonas brassicacearum]
MLAMAESQLASMLDVPPLSRASSAPTLALGRCISTAHHRSLVGASLLAMVSVKTDISTKALHYSPKLKTTGLGGGQPPGGGKFCTPASS